MKNLSFRRNGKEFEPTKYELKKVLDDYAERLAIAEKALQIAIFELDFYKNHSQTTDSETYERIIKLRNEILVKAKEIIKNG
jgi:hypothetical protein